MEGVERRTLGAEDGRKPGTDSGEVIEVFGNWNFKIPAELGVRQPAHCMLGETQTHPSPRTG